MSKIEQNQAYYEDLRLGGLQGVQLKRNQEKNRQANARDGENTLDSDFFASVLL
jgi:hypothetical protein